MAITGPDGHNAPELRPDGTHWTDWQEINARAFTAHGREPFLPDFGIGIEDSLGNPSLSAAEIRNRLAASLETSYLRDRGVEVSIGGTVYRIEARAAVPPDAP